MNEFIFTYRQSGNVYCFWFDEQPLGTFVKTDSHDDLACFEREDGENLIAAVLDESRVEYVAGSILDRCFADLRSEVPPDDLPF